MLKIWWFRLALLLTDPPVWQTDGQTDRQTELPWLRRAESSLLSRVTIYFGASRSFIRSSLLTFLRSSSPVLVMISRISVPICNHFHVRRANNGRITSSFKGPVSPPRSWGPFSPSGMKFCHEILETLSYIKSWKPEVSLTWAPIGTRTCHQDTKTELPYLIRAIASARKNSIKLICRFVTDALTQWWSWHNPDLPDWKQSRDHGWPVHPLCLENDVVVDTDTVQSLQLPCRI